MKIKGLINSFNMLIHKANLKLKLTRLISSGFLFVDFCVLYGRKMNLFGSLK